MKDKVKSFNDFLNEGESYFDPGKPSKHVKLTPERREEYKADLKKVMKKHNYFQAVLDKKEILNDLNSIAEEIVNEWNNVDDTDKKKPSFINKILGKK